MVTLNNTKKPRNKCLKVYFQIYFWQGRRWADTGVTRESKTGSSESRICRMKFFAPFPNRQIYSSENTVLYSEVNSFFRTFFLNQNTFFITNYLFSYLSLLFSCIHYIDMYFPYFLCLSLRSYKCVSVFHDSRFAQRSLLIISYTEGPIVNNFP